MMKNKAGWVALIVLATASVLMVFFVLPNIDKGKETVTADAPADSPAGLADTKGARPIGEGEAEKTPATAADAGPAGAADTWTVPGFDVVRVEPDGSTVIAGRAQPNTKLEIVNGDTVIGTADVGATGDFAAIFDKPLPAGDYQLTLRSVGENGVTKSSEEVATVSVPKDKAGELLAMVSKPGEASRILTTPEIDTKPADTASQPSATADQLAKAEPAPDAASTDMAVSVQTPATGNAPPVAVSAVEIEGKKIFVAGNARAGALVRIYADDKLVGEMRADEQGRFVVDGAMDLAVGNHTIRADIVGADGKVELRAAVPFDRPAGDQVAAVAQGNAQGSVVPFEGGSFDGLRMEATKALGLLKGLFADGKVPTAEELAAARSATEIALKSLADFKVADSLDASVKEMTAKTAKAATDALAMLKALPTDAASVSASLGKIEVAVGSALMPRTDGTGGSAVVADVTPTPAQNDLADPATQTAGKPAAESATPSAQSGAVATAAVEPETVQQAPLQQSKASVIIRRGDTLWQISRRVYGAGVRYTTIYLANEDQITDPDRILPGQIFGVPDTAMPERESEEMHRKRVKHER